MMRFIPSLSSKGQMMCSARLLWPPHGGSLYIC